MHRRSQAVSLALSLLLAVSLASLALADDAHPQLVRVPLDGGVTAQRLRDAGFDVIEEHSGEVLVLEWATDAGKLEALGARRILVDADPGRTAAERAKAEFAIHPRLPGRMVKSAVRPDGIYRTEVLPPFGSGSMGGYWTLAEVKMKLDDLVANDTQDLVANAVDSIGTTRQNRPVWGLKLGKAVAGPDTRPVAYFSAITHAREPEGMQALFYFVDDLLSKYGTDPTATYLLDHRVIYICPVVNPDGYERNRTTNPNGGGFWRKNLRDNDNNGIINTQDGVDINRNYGFQWGLSPGSSNQRTADDYRGPSAFSEPETQAQRNICSLLQPITGLSFHTYADVLVHPWGYTETATVDSMKFYEWDDDMSMSTGYHTGLGPRVLYPVSGEFNDWCYGDVVLKPRMYSWTPEVGGPGDGFWPAPSRIVPLARENLRHCYYVASIAGPYARIESFSLQEGLLNAGYHAHLSVRARNKGQTGVAGPNLIGTLSSLSAGASVIQPTLGFPDLASFQSADPTGGATFEIAADDTVTPGRLLRFRLDFTADDGYFSRDTVEIVCGTPTVLVNDDASAGTGLWTTTTWGTENIDVSHPGPYFADSPNANYTDSSNRIFTLTAPLNLTAGVHAYALWNTRWEFEQDYDCGLFEASLNGTTWTPIGSQGTSLGDPAGQGTQPIGQPVFEGARHLWRGERSDLSAFTGGAATGVRLRYRVLSDVGTVYDGFRVDDVRVHLYDPAQQPLPVAVGNATSRGWALAMPSPNPAQSRVRLAFDVPAPGPVRLDVLDVQGRRVRTIDNGWLAAGRYEHGWDARDDSGRPVAAGMYVIRLSGAATTLTRRCVVMR
jgi:carboxypeptidase T